MDDAADKLRDVLSGIIDGDHIVDTVASFRKYGTANILGVHVGSMHAARLYTESQKQYLPKGICPEIVIIDECHHAASEGALAGVEVRRQIATQTYIAAKQLLSGEFWEQSRAPQLAILMSATPFRSAAQFVNLLRLLTHGIERSDGSVFSAFDGGIQATDLRNVLQDERTAASVVWRRQSDEGVRSWSGNRIFPNLKVVRPHQVPDNTSETPRLPQPSSQFLELLSQVKSSVTSIARAHNQAFGGFAIAQLEKKLTSSSVAGACWLFSWAVRHSFWETQEEYKNDKGHGTEGLRRLIRRISQRIAEYNTQSTTGHSAVRFPSDGFEFDAKSLAQPGVLFDIQKYSKAMREDAPEVSKWLADQPQIAALVDLAETLLNLGKNDGDKRGAEDAKLAWLNDLLQRHPDDRFILFTESLQTCEVLESALGSTCRVLVGSMSKAARTQAVADLRNPRMNARVLVATSAADEGFDLQVASKVIHWDLSSSPAILMQRNGRVARLGQVRDVIAYYLILTGTHEERRDSTLQVKFAELGIDDEAMKSRILGSLTEQEEDQLEQAIEDSATAVVGDILKKAKGDNEKMDEELASITATLKESQVLSREDLAARLSLWKELGLPDAAVGDIEFEFHSMKWDRPVFAEASRMEPAEAKTARFRNDKITQDLVFDPEYLVFGPKESGRHVRLAGLPPWIKKSTRYDRPCIVPYDKSDVLGRLLQGAARLQRADFLVIPRDCLGNQRWGAEARWLLFCTHPLREVENVQAPKQRPYLTYYAFSDIVVGVTPTPLDEEGADAAEVHDFLYRAEQYALRGVLFGVDDGSTVEAARNAGTGLQAWVESVTKFGAQSFLDEAKYFVPIPVALVSIVSSREHALKALFEGNEQVVRFAEAVLLKIEARSDHAFHLSELDETAINAGCSADEALSALAVLASRTVGKLRLDLRTGNGVQSPVTASEFVEQLRSWWKDKAVTDDAWREWAEGVEVRWIACASGGEVS